MDSPVFVKRGMAVRKGELARSSVVVRSVIEPIWAGPSLRTIFMDKNIAGYCGYIGLVSFVVYRPAIALLIGVLIGPTLASRPDERRKHRAGRR
jgi:hypothetical protein